MDHSIELKFMKVWKMLSELSLMGYLHVFLLKSFDRNSPVLAREVTRNERFPFQESAIVRKHFVVVTLARVDVYSRVIIQSRDIDV